MGPPGREPARPRPRVASLRRQGTDVGLYFVLFGLVASFLSVFWSMGRALRNRRAAVVQRRYSGAAAPVQNRGGCNRLCTRTRS